ncbi:MAG: DUF362 domain-containing protein [Chitinivibrionales bacterium]|nr:DUF362 domain-containing protein [Chitinivibrionales bacterium]
MNHINRRVFLSTAAQSAAGLGVVAGCNSRQSTGPDVRPPSAPQGLTSIAGDQQVELTWLPHQHTDITGAPSERAIRYHIYRDSVKITHEPLSDPTYIDVAVQNGTQYRYYIKAVDDNGNESPASPIISAEPTAVFSKIYRVTDANASSGRTLNGEVVKSMLHSAVRAMSGSTELAAAYESLFPGLSATSTIAVKINCLAGNTTRGLCTHPQVVDALIDGLTHMFGGTYPARNITVFDDRNESFLTNAGFTLRDDDAHAKVVTTQNSWGTATHRIGLSSQRLSTIVEQADYLINVPVLKDHTEAGITFALKNCYGMIDKPAEIHDNKCSPFVAEVYSLVKAKMKLIVGDAIFGADTGGPSTGPKFAANSLLVATDPVAVDVQALRMINDRRTQKISTDSATGAARHVAAASKPPYSLGNANPDVVDVAVGSSV